MIYNEKLRRLLLLFVIVLGSLNMGLSQNSDDAREVTNTYYIKNAFVVQKPGTILSNTSIIVKDGMIQSVGPNIAIPFDAQVIDADSMYVYAGFIDACSHAGIKKPESGENPSVKDPGNPPKRLAGITPQNTVRASMEKVDKSMKDLKELGFGFVHVVPRGRMMPGMGSVLSTGGEDPESTIIKEDISQFSQFRSARRMFPGTTIGVMSQFRDLLINAKNYSAYERTYNANPRGLKRPAQSEELEALYSVVSREMPVFFYTPKVKDVNRAMILNKELGFNMVLTGMRQGWPLMDDIIAGRHQVVLSLKLPEEIKDEKKDDEKKDESKKEEAKDGAEKVAEKVEKKKEEKPEDPELKMMKEKKKKSHDAYVGQAATFEGRNVAFSFSTLDTKSKDVRGNILRMVKGGLSENGALAALTTNPARLLGISQMAGTVEQGKIANLFITDKPYFDEKSKIKFILNDGTVKENKEEKKKKKAGNGEAVSLAGDWSFEVEIPGETQSGTIRIEGEEDDLQVSVESSDEPGEFMPATNVSQSGNELSFDLTVEGMVYNLSLTFEAEDFEGQLSVGEFGSFPMSGSKKPE